MRNATCGMKKKVWIIVIYIRKGSEAVCLRERFVAFAKRFCVGYIYPKVPPMISDLPLAVAGSSLYGKESQSTVKYIYIHISRCVDFIFSLV